MTSTKQRRRKGTGSIWDRNDGGVLWIKYSHNGVLYREATNTTAKRKAVKILEQRIAELKTGTFVPPSTQRIRIDELAEDLLQDYRINQRKSIDDANARWELHLKPFFGGLRANALTSDHINRYIEHRQKDSAKNATVNRELALLKRMLRLGHQATPPKVVRLIRIHKLRENNVRQGFLTDEQFDNLLACCTTRWLRALLVIGRTYGWRVSELRAMRVSQIDLARGTVRLEVGTTKNRDGREVTMTKTVNELLAQCIDGKGPSDFVFTRPCGKPVRDFRILWQYACVQAGVGLHVCPRCGPTTLVESKCGKCKARHVAYRGLLFHDLRRTAARNLRAAGVAEGVIMKIGGWKTRSVFERYAIVTNQDVADAMTKLEKHEQHRSRIGHVAGSGATLQTQENSSTLESSTL